ncbi:MAG: dienelactone hydrolase family protein [Chloroflexota bacterium]|nr:dienelactone hydrolase family protein [Chloroflexota bacterium]
MCYDLDARPPIPPMSGGAADGEDIVLTAPDGNRFAAYIAYSAQANGPQVLIFPDIRGLHQFYKELALRFAEVGVRALAIDYFGRTAGITPRDDQFDYAPYVEQMTMPTFLRDVAAALAYLKSQSKTPRATCLVGFCRGGTLALHTGAEVFDLSGIIAFYAGLSRPIPGAKGSTLEQASKIRYPLLGLFGGADPGIPESDRQQLDQQLDVAGVQHEIVAYVGAPHSFFDRRYAEFANASEDAWKRVLGFIDTRNPKS